jgi:hypothetical protein
MRHPGRALKPERRREAAANAAVVAKVEFEAEPRPGPTREAAVVVAEGQLASRSIRRST